MPDKPDHEALYYIPVEVLKLPEDTLLILKSRGFFSIGDCVYYIQMIRSAAILPNGPIAFLKAMVELKSRLEEHGYDTFDTAGQ